MIYFISDLHFNHNKEFIFKERGFLDVNEMNEAIIRNWNSKIKDSDNVYIVGDVMLGDDEEGIKLLKRLKGNIHIIRGNHDSKRRIELFKKLENVKRIANRIKIEYENFIFDLRHYPPKDANVEQIHPKIITVILSGHTHSKEKFYNGNSYIYNVACDAHNCTPVSIEEVKNDIIEAIKNK